MKHIQSIIFLVVVGFYLCYYLATNNYQMVSIVLLIEFGILSVWEAIKNR